MRPCVPEVSHPAIRWSSRITFITAAAGAAIGLGNIWKFPYLVGENGGGAFVLVYLLCVLAAGLPIMMAETLLGRMGRKNPVDSLLSLSKTYQKTRLWALIGWLGITAGLAILSYYSVVAGWGMAYLFKMSGGFLANITPEESLRTFDELKSSPDTQTIWHSVFMVLTALIVGRGLKEGIESVTRIMIPCLLVILILLVGYGATTNGFAKSAAFLFQPDFSKLTGEGVLIALGQAFFSLGLANGTTLIYGSYLPEEVSIARTALWVASADTLAAILAGLAIFSIVFANGMEPSAGPGLIFETLPIAFGSMPLGWLFGTTFFILVFFAAITSAIALIEPAVSFLSEKWGLSRARASVIAASACWLLGLGTVHSFQQGKTSDGAHFYEVIDFLTADLMLPMGGILISVFAAWVVPKAISEAELDAGKAYSIWLLLTRFVAPLAVLVIFLRAMNWI